VKQQFGLVLVQVNQNDEMTFQAFILKIFFLPFAEVFTRPSFQTENESHIKKLK